MSEIRKEALRETIKTVAGIVVISLLVPFVLYTVPLNVLAVVFAVAMLTFAIKMVYDIQLNRAESKALLKEMVDKR
jgi:uncharacterized membrane protein